MLILLLQAWGAAWFCSPTMGKRSPTCWVRSVVVLSCPELRVTLGLSHLCPAQRHPDHAFSSADYQAPLSCLKGPFLSQTVTTVLAQLATANGHAKNIPPCVFSLEGDGFQMRFFSCWYTAQNRSCSPRVPLSPLLEMLY